MPPILKALLLQLLAICLAALAIRSLGWHPSLLAVATGIGVLAALMSYLAEFPRWWMPIQLLFVPALTMAYLLQLPSWIYLVGFLVLAPVYWSTYRTQVPLYLSSRAVWQALETLLPMGKPFDFADIGAGVGGVLDHLATVRPEGRFNGIEHAPIPFLLAWIRVQKHPNCRMLHGDFWKMDLGKYDFVYAYLSPVPMGALWEKARREMKAGSLLISNTFEIPAQLPDRVIPVEDFHRSKILIWRIPEPESL